MPDKQTLVYEMIEEVSGEISLPGPGGDWRPDMHVLAGRQRVLLRPDPAAQFDRILDGLIGAEPGDR